MSRNPLPDSTLDRILTAQLIVAWAGEDCDGERLGWWRTDLASDEGGRDLFARLLPATWPWAAFEAAREAARRHDRRQRHEASDGDEMLSLFHLGPKLDERIDERLQDLKRSGRPPEEALPALRDMVSGGWDRAAFADWLGSHGTVTVSANLAGRRITGDPPEAIERVVDKLVAGHHPIDSKYPLPHYRGVA